jgi:hypothetical protein
MEIVEFDVIETYQSDKKDTYDYVQLLRCNPNKLKLVSIDLEGGDMEHNAYFTVGKSKNNDLIPEIKQFGENIKTLGNKFNFNIYRLIQTDPNREPDCSNEFVFEKKIFKTVNSFIKYLLKLNIEMMEYPI